MRELSLMFTQWPLPACLLLAYLAYLFRDVLRRKLAAILKLNTLVGNAEFDKDQSAELVREIAKDIEDAKRLPRTDRVEPTIAHPTPTRAQASAETDHRSPMLASSPLYLEVEQSIRNDPKLAMLATDKAKIDVLIHFQARVQAELTFERMYRLIFGSQLQAVRLADRPGGIPIADVMAIFESAKAAFPVAHGERTFERWVEFMFDTGLMMRPSVVGDLATVQTSEYGHEFNVYVTALRLSEPYG